MIDVLNITKSFNTGGSRVDVLNGINLSVKKGESLSIVGRSGAGKSTLLHIMGAIEEPSGGTITFHGQDIFAMRSNELANFRNLHIGFVFQFHHLLPEFTALENIAMPAIIRGKTKKQALLDAQVSLNAVGLKHRGTHKPGELSGGEQQRIALARAFSLKPSVILADEPTGNLDTQTGKEVFSLLMNFCKSEGLSIIIVTHDDNLAARTDRIIQIVDGIVVPL